MIHSKISEIIAVDVHTWRTSFNLISISGVKRITKIKCFAVAQEIQKPFSIYPVIFDFESNDISLMPCEIIACITPDIKIEGNKIIETNIYIVEGELILNCESKYSGQIVIRGYARLMCPLAVSPKAFFIIEYEG